MKLKRELKATQKVIYQQCATYKTPIDVLPWVLCDHIFTLCHIRSFFYYSFYIACNGDSLLMLLLSFVIGVQNKINNAPVNTFYEA